MNDTNANTETSGAPCHQCPWRVANQGRAPPGRVLPQGQPPPPLEPDPQSCHPTDPSHPHHRQYAGAKRDARPLECIGSVILVLREMRYADTLDGDTTAGELSTTDFERYMAETAKRKGLTRDGLLYHGFARALPRPIGDRTPLPSVAGELLDSAAYGRPDEPPLPTTRTARRDPAATATPN